MTRETTKDNLLEEGRRLFLERGYNHAGIESVLQAAGVPKGSFYHYFQSKEDFGLQVLDRFAAAHEADLERFLGDVNLRPLDRLWRLAEATEERLKQWECRNGCLVGNLSQEMSGQSEAFRARLDGIFRGWAGRYAACLGGSPGGRGGIRRPGRLRAGRVLAQQLARGGPPGQDDPEHRAAEDVRAADVAVRRAAGFREWWAVGTE